MKLVELRGLSAKDAEKLMKVGIKTSEGLLLAAKTKKDRQALAEKTKVKEADILELVNRADLARIKGIGRQYSNLLELAGVDTVAELAKRVPENLVAKMEEVNAKEKAVEKTPSLTSVENWIEQAKKLPRGIEY